MGTISRSQMRQFSRHAILWIAAYAFLLQTILAPMLMARVSNPDINQALLVLCSGRTTSMGATTDGIPSKAHDADTCCKLCVGCGGGVIVDPEVSLASAYQPTRPSIP